MRSPILLAESLSVVFDRPGQQSMNALSSLTLTVNEGEFVAVIGSSGAGKTTFLRCLTGFVRPSSGSLVVDGTRVADCDQRELNLLRRRVATVYQHFNLVERATALQNVLHGRLGFVGALRGTLGFYSRDDQEIAFRALDWLGLADRALQRVDRLSGGERQRVAIARALVQRPRMILADEPAASLDVALTRQVIATLRELNEQLGLTVLVNIHDLDLARAFATRVVALRRGSVVFDGTPDQLGSAAVEAIYADPSTRSERSAVAAMVGG